MSFRYIQKCNNALLAKQVLRLLHKKDTLVFKVFSAKYFRSGNILDANFHPRCSYAWRSILQARNVINKGAVWRVGDWSTIDVWGHRWLLAHDRSKVISPRLSSPVMHVKDLFYPSTRIWDSRLLDRTC